MAIPVSGNLALLYLTALKEVAGPQYTAILQQAGWGRFLDTPPPATDAPVLSGEESHRMIVTCFSMLGEDIYRLFQRNIGAVAARQILAGPWAALRDEAQQIPAAQRPRWVLEQQAVVLAHAGIHHTISEDATAWYSTVAPGDCGACAAIRTAKAPICAGTTVGLKTVLDAICGRSYRVAEVECEAMGAPQCKYAVSKPA
jgi:hypothetical protein